MQNETYNKMYEDDEYAYYETSDGCKFKIPLEDANKYKYNTILYANKTYEWKKPIKKAEKKPMIQWQKFEDIKPELDKEIFAKQWISTHLKTGVQEFEYHITKIIRPFDKEPNKYNENYYEFLDNDLNCWQEVPKDLKWTYLE